jgi:hypothetical protein
MVKINAKTRKLINDALYEMCKRRQRSIPLADINTLLSQHGMQTEDYILCGTNSNANIDVFTADGQEVNTMLALSWLKGDHDQQWEVNAYLS